MKVSQSKIKVWRWCRRHYEYKYVHMLRKRVKSRPLQFGTIFHNLLEDDAEGIDPHIRLKALSKHKMFKEEVEEYGNIIEDIGIIYDGYVKYWKKKDPLRFIKINGKINEIMLETPLIEDITYVFKVDGYARDRVKHKWLVEHKTGRDTTNDEIRFWDLQSTMYIWGGRELGIEVDGVMWNYIKSKAPTIPQLLKNGDLSERMNIATTWDVYKKAILDNDLKVKDYSNMKEALDGREGLFYNRIYLPASKDIITNLVKEFRCSALEIRDHGHKIGQVRTMGKPCGWCDMYLICQANLRGLDEEEIKTRYYKVEKAQKQKIRYRKKDGTTRESI